MTRWLVLVALVGCASEPAPFDPDCGDGLLQAAELCDDGVNDGAYGGCAPGCRARAPYCGDDEVNGDEACDDGINDGAYGSCTPDCAARAGYCGDGVVSGPERCDDGENQGGYGGCRPGCDARGPYCGDATVNGPEGCDDGVNDGVCGSCTEDCAEAAVAPQLTTLVVRALGGNYGWPVDTPDVYVEVFDGAGELVLVTEVIDDRDVPVTFNLDPVLVDGAVWTAHVWDDDGGGFGDDDDMGAVDLDTSVLDGTAARAGTRVSWLIEELACE